MSESIRHITKCRFCNKEFLAPALALPTIGEPPSKNVERYIEVLAKHIVTAHQAEWQQILAISAQFTGILVLRQFDTQDEALCRAEDIARYQVHQITRRNLPPTDAGLKANLETHEGKEDAAFEALKELRDYLIEAAVFQAVSQFPQ
jgi:hypothetical protein